MSSDHDSIKHINYLRQSLSQDKKPIGFFLSAGCPLSIQLPDDEWPLIPDVENLTKIINEKLKPNDKYQLLLVELTKTDQDTNNIEHILSFIRGLLQVSKGGEVRGFTECDLLDLEKEVCLKIVEQIDVIIPKQDTPFHRLANWIRSIDREIPIEIFTTNYDTIIEQSLEDLEIPYFDGFVGSRRPFFDLRAVENNLIPKHWTKLWKLHGSINWYNEGTGDKKRIYRSSEIKKGESSLVYPSHLKYEQSRKMPYLALIDQLGKFVKLKSSLLIVAGYSFNDAHLNDTILNALKSNPTGMVLCFMYESFYKDKELNERYPNAYSIAKKQHNLNIWTFDKAIIGTSFGSWIKHKDTDDEEIRKFVEVTRNKESGTEEIIIKMGDFSIFTEFLKSLIGFEKETHHD